MTRVATRFAGYHPSRHCVEAVRAGAAWLTGQSSYRHSQLAPEQLALLDRLEDVGFTPVRAGQLWTIRGKPGTASAMAR